MHAFPISAWNIPTSELQGQVDITPVANVRPIKMRLVIFKNNDFSNGSMPYLLVEESPSEIFSKDPNAVLVGKEPMTIKS